jgi:predicted dehydrogenase
MDSSKVFVGVVGAGTIAGNMHLPVLKSMSEVQVAWLTDVNERKGNSVATAYEVPFVRLPPSPGDLPSCDVVLLAIPLASRPPYYELFARRNAALLAEKPFAISMEDHAQFQRAYSPGQIGCGYMRRMYSSNRLLRRIVKERWFGPLQRLRICEGARTTKTGFDGTYQDLDIAAGGGIMLAIGCHVLDLAFFITEADGFGVYSKNILFDENTDRKAQASLVLKNLQGVFGSDCDFEFCVSWLDAQSNTIELEFETARVTGHVKPGKDIEIRSRDDVSLRAAMTPIDDGATTSNQAFYLEWKSFLRGAQAKQPCDVAASRSLITARVIDDLVDGRNRRQVV